MKEMRARKLILSVAAMLFLLAVSGLAAADNSKKLTIMVYMCGSDLESEYGSASEDIREMIDSGFSAEDTTVLVMLGGSPRWTRFPGLEGNGILVIQGPKSRMEIKKPTLLNMGKPKTLTQLLEYGAENYPAEDYALILWDHGGGPLEGVCWDVLFSDDHMTLAELTEGIREGWRFKKKLSWIGFDACLMGSAEVAAAVAPYAEYMIASQETEPAKGWNYAFLKEASGDGAATGRIIVDSYFDGLKGSSDPLTMACIDLARIDPLIQQMDSYFSELDSKMDRDHFEELSRIRYASTGFGKAVRAVGTEGYDLVDLADLIARYGGNNAAVSQSLQETVVYVRSDNGGACGLSVYHPYYNKEKYLESWQDYYRRLNFSPMYSRYLEHFGAILTGKEYTDWSGMITTDEGMVGEEAHAFSLELTDAQVRNCLSAELIVMEQFGSTEGVLSLAPISIIPAALNSQGKLTAEYRGNALYALDENGKILSGPVSYRLTDDGSYYILLCSYLNNSPNNTTKNDTIVLYYCTLDSATGGLDIARTYVYDPVSDNYTNRIPFTEEGLTDLGFQFFIRNMPDSREAIRGFDEWEPYDGYWARNIKLPIKWHLQFQEDWNSSDIYAMFQVTDIYQNTWCSLPVKVENPREKELAVTQTIGEMENLDIQCSARMKRTTLHPYIQIRVTVNNQTGSELILESTRMVLNGTRTTDQRLYPYNLEAGKTGEKSCMLQKEALIGLTSLSSVDFTLYVAVSGDHSSEPTQIPIHLDLAVADLGELAKEAPKVLAEAQDGDMTWQLVSLEQAEDGQISGLLHIENHGSTDFSSEGRMLINGMQADSSPVNFDLRPETDNYHPFTFTNRATLSSLTIAGKNTLYQSGINQALEQGGFARADRVDVWLESGLFPQTYQNRGITLQMEDGISLQAAEKMPEAKVLLDGSDLHVSIEQVLVADDGIGIGVRLENHLDETVCLEMIRPNLDGKEYDEFSLGKSIIMPPDTRAVHFIVLKSRKAINPGMPAEELTFRFKRGNFISEPAIIRFPAGTVFGAETGTILTAGDLDITSTAFMYKPMALNEEIIVTDAVIHPVMVTAPVVSAERGDAPEQGIVQLCVLSGKEGQNAETGEWETVRPIARANLKQTGSQWNAVFSGLACVVEDQLFLATNETQLDTNRWEIDSDNVYFYQEPGKCQTMENSDLFFDTDALYSDISFTAEILDGHAAISSPSMFIRGWGKKIMYDRTNLYLDEIAETAMQQRVRFISDDDIFYHTETHMLPAGSPVTFRLVPLDAIKGRKALTYALFWQDGSREDTLVDYETGVILEQTFRTAEE